MESKCKVLNQDTIKYIATIAMIINHIVATIALKNDSFKDTTIYELCLHVGYCTAPIMCYFLVEGYHYTHDKIAYGARLLGFGLISQLFYMASGTGGSNMIIMLFICFLLLWTREHCKNKYLKAIIYVLLVVATSVLDCPWRVVSPIFVLLLDKYRDSATGTAISFVLLYFATAINEGYCDWYYSTSRNVMDSVSHALIGISPVLLAGICILFFYNGKRCTKHKTLNKWAFYIIYPLHFWILSLFM